MTDSKIKLQFELNKANLDQLDFILLKTNATTRVEVIRKALSLYAYLISKEEKGFYFELVNKEERYHLELFLI